MGVDALFVSFVPNVAYFTGKKGDDCFLYITGDEAFILTDFRYREMAMELKDRLTFVETSIDVTISSFMSSRPENVIGVEKDYLPLASYLTFKEKMPDKEFKPVSGVIEKLRMIKDEAEMEATRRAAEIGCRTFDHMCGFLKPGITELEAAAELEYTMRKLGAEGTSFDTILISGAKTSYPHGVPGLKKIENGDFVTMDFGCKVGGYCSDMTRTVAVGEPTDEMKKVYEVVRRAQQAACDGIRPGMKGCDIHKIAADIIEEAGYGKYFGHGLGHGTGLEIHELPRYSPAYKEPIEENCIVSIEPGIYLPGRFGVRIEDLAIVKAGGIINLVDSPKELVIL